MQYPSHGSLTCHQEIFVPPEQLICFEPRYTVNTVIAPFLFGLGKSLVHLQQLLRASSQVLVSYTTNFITFIFRSFFPFYIKFFTHLLTLVLLSVYFVNLPQILYRSRDFTSPSGVWDRLMLASGSALSTSLPKSNFSDSINIGSLKQATVVVFTPWIPANITNRMFCLSEESVY